MATWALVRAERKVDGERHLVGKFLKNDVVGQVFEHSLKCVVGINNKTGRL